MSGPWERFVRRFSVGVLLIYTVIAVAVTATKASRERYIFPISMMKMYSGIKPLSPAQRARLEELRGR